MLHPMFLPLLLIPHVVIPASLLYLIYSMEHDTPPTSPTMCPAIKLPLHTTDEPSGPSKTSRRRHARPRRHAGVVKDLSQSVSPMRQFARENLTRLREERYRYINRREAQKIPSSPMRTLVQTVQFQRELKDRLRCPAISRSPMHQLARTESFKEHISDLCLVREVERELIETNPMRLMCYQERDNIQTLARRMSFKRELQSSRMHQFIRGYLARTNIMQHALYMSIKAASMNDSPLRRWTIENGTLIQASAKQMAEIRDLRSQTLGQIKESLNKNYGRLYRRYALREYRRQNNIPEVQLLPGCNSYATIVFPQDVQIVDRFLADCNLDGMSGVSLFTGCTIYIDKNHYRSYASALITAGNSIDDLTDTAQTFKNISHLTHKDTQVQILADSSKIQCPEGSGIERKLEFYFVKRDRNNFTLSDYKTCSGKITDFLRRFPDLTVSIGFVGRWLGDTMLVTLSGTSQAGGKIKYTNISTDLIQTVNLVKGVIFQKIVDRTCWLHLP